MTLLELSARVLGVVGVMLVVASLVFVGPRRLREMRTNIGSRLREAGPAVAVLGGVLAINGFIRDVSTDLSQLIGVRITSTIHAIEGAFVGQIQTVASPALTTYFSNVYVYGYAFLMLFPLVAYLAIDDQRPMRELTVAFILNYGIGLLCYLAFIAYGPRNFMPDVVEPLLYTHWPRAQLLTSEINRNTNVFPSLHTSLSVTVALMAYRTRDAYPYWLPVAVFMAGSVAVSTMYLGIHWGTDVVAGLLLAVFSVAAAIRIREFGDRHDGIVRDRVDEFADRLR
ncbi:phosphatase PAP2 family protein [Halorientalis regularis]|uniref:PAP2 superfamily protein n=1 Tax=Halorientalis regularis TaxID=660518 RepID=A0A1G7I1P6_9EURY|nr:phosphatase PAP2 family protein [Halorientalis regularis]SDF06670.1 PAP2 superfamily protein [Halorientalis regularis]